MNAELPANRLFQLGNRSVGVDRIGQDSRGKLVVQNLDDRADRREVDAVFVIRECDEAEQPEANGVESLCVDARRERVVPLCPRLFRVGHYVERQREPAQLLEEPLPD